MSDDEGVSQSGSSAEDIALALTSSEQEGEVSFAKLRPKTGWIVVKMYTPYKTYFEGDALSISALNDTGEFDVLPGHHNFITMLKPCTVTIQLPEQSSRKIPIVRGLMHVRKDRVLVFLDV